MVAVQQHFSRVKALEYQIEVSEQARLSLEMQIQANNRKNLDLEQWLRQREEDLRSLQQLIECLQPCKFKTKPTNFHFHQIS